MRQALSNKAKSLWAKSDRESGDAWLPLYVHLLDALGVAGLLWDRWLPEGTKESIARFVGGDLELARKTYLFLSAVHDLGKATPLFQSKPVASGQGFPGSLAWKPEHAGLYIRPDLASVRHPLHAVAGQVLLEQFFCDRGWDARVAASYASVIGSHHGVFPDSGVVRDASLSEVELGISGEGADGWKAVHRELVEFMLNVARLDATTFSHLSNCVLPVPIASLLTGLVIMADWMASDGEVFPLIPLDCGGLGDADDGFWPAFERRLRKAWNDLSIAPAWSEQYLPETNSGRLLFERFDLPASATPHPIQEEVIEIAQRLETPGLMLIEAPMGEGKTEAALAAAEILAARFGRGGVCVALPTMATTDAMFARVHNWLDRLPHGDLPSKSLFLAHGKSRLNEEFSGIVKRSRSACLSVDAWEHSEPRDAEARMPDRSWRTESAFASDWMFGRKKGMLSNFVVCTVDQVLMAALNMRHLSMRHIAVANKVVIIDECHAYDAYMQEYLRRALEWLGYWGTPVILLSATLPHKQRIDMTESYLRGRRSSLELPLTSRRSALSWKDKIGRRECRQAPNAESRPLDKLPEEAYPLITYTSDVTVEWARCASSGRRCDVRLFVHDEASMPVEKLLSNLLSEGGCAGVICDTVSRAQNAADRLGKLFGQDAVILDHSRFVDIDRMAIEERIRGLLGPASTIENGLRPRLLIVVGTQVLEQSLDIDFDVLVTDVAPVDLLLQRMGRMHRHLRGNGESSRPRALRTPQCYLTGVSGWGGIPRFEPGITSVYDAASLYESLAALDIDEGSRTTTISIPEDISHLVQTAYSTGIRTLIPDAWKSKWVEACRKRDMNAGRKKSRANQCRIQSAARMQRERYSLIEMAATHSTTELEADFDAGSRAIRDTQESVDVLLLRRTGDGLALLPWVGDERHGVRKGGSVPIDTVPPPALAKVVAQSSVRLPLSLCPAGELESLILELEDACSMYVGAWQESPWLVGRLVLPLDEGAGSFVARIHGHKVTYTARGGIACQIAGS
ncbi:CRISPR-associated helicase Cas3' [Parafannyhessea umbonata]|uniref:CRISPR-associated helicase, Cas3 family n=1 Tax=Parafannyhessea umbonata TaxID=604330 RepID=A0A1H9N187_9ACTN|nr:CRISPR-associated helicase Cas3' [Parafannyhessea umbonata]SER29489.1 CRISPR-associated helicase, Cas3 family [Parafannyhessea umbonata]